ncbi:unnamed protein product [Parnassius mnemosyne]|uniref:BTB domain-containing protein n=1 Tax=Parnassius mnemosyne TaxID=213953 RepID=A0AAV1LWW8_9NEOP
MHDNEVSALNTMKCQTADAKKLCIYDIGLKLKSPGQYDIGGTYTADQPDLWFFYVTSVCPGYNYLLNLFLCHRKSGIVSLGISNGDELTHQIINDVDNSSLLSDTLTWQTLNAIQPNGKSFVKTFCFSEADVSKMNHNTLVIPVAIQMDPKRLKTDVVTNRIKLQHDLGDMLLKQEKTDFIIKTPSQKEYKTHKIVLAAHSSVLRNMIKSLKENIMFIDITDNDLELLLEFLYTGTVKDIMKRNCLHLLEIAEQFQLKNLILLTKHAINKQKNSL